MRVKIVPDNNINRESTFDGGIEEKSNFDAMSANNQQMKKSMGQANVKMTNKVGRNDPCPCGSGKKYKHCHGK